MDKMRVNRLRWFGHVMRRKDSEAIRIVMELTVEERKGKGRPKKKWLNGIKCDMRIAGVCVNDVGDRVEWRLRTKVADPK